MRFHYIVADVFSETPFGGNQLAVLTDARGISDAGMQAITREFNYAETTFVLPPDDPANTARVRIFTPGRELPFAGHPTVGTACVLVMSGAAQEGRLMLEEGVGPVAVHVERSGSGLTGTLTLERGPEVMEDVPAAADASALLSLPEAEIAEIFCAGTGVDFTFIRLADAGAVDRLSFDTAVWQRLFANRWGPQVYIFAGELADGAELYGRMFAPALGILEDPATGSAVAALVGAAALKVATGPDFNLSVLQGVALGRRSLLVAKAELAGGKVTRVHVTGASAFVAEGEIEVPDEYIER